MARLCGWTALALVALAMSCGDDNPDGGDVVCAPGHSRECTGPDGCRGSQECKQDGSGHGGCVCAGGTGGSATSGSSAAGSGMGGSDTGSSDTGGTNGSGGDSLGGEASGAVAATGGDLGICKPADMSDWTPPPYVPARPAESVCTSTEIADYFANSCQFGGCVEYEAGGALEACGRCLSPSDVHDAAYGPVIRLAVGTTTLVESNSAGCVELAGQADCAASFQARDACLREACLRTCPPGDRLFGACMNDARTTSCADHASPGACLLLATAEACNGPDVFALVATVFCG